jgi:DNA-directed RNA polymerase subunit K/omega
MSKINEYLAFSTENYINTQNLDEIFENTGNLYQSIVIIAKRANQIASELKNELHFKLEDMRKITDEIDEITESREQIELSKHYEKLAHPTLIATKEFLESLFCPLELAPPSCTMR